MLCVRGPVGKDPAPIWAVSQDKGVRAELRRWDMECSRKVWER